MLAFFILGCGSALYADDIYNKDAPQLPTYMSGRNASFTYEKEVEPAETPEEENPEEMQPKLPEEKRSEEQQPELAEGKKTESIKHRPIKENDYLGAYSYIHPHSKIQVLYDDNIFDVQEVSKKKYDMVTIVDPGIGFMLGKRDESNITLDGGVRYDTYYLNHYLNQIKPLYYGTGSAQLVSRYNKLQASYDLRRIPTVSASVAQGASGITSVVYSNAMASWKYSKKRLELNFDYSSKNWWYEEDTKKIYTNNVNTFDATGYIKTRDFPKTQLLFETCVGTQNFPKASPLVKYSDASCEDYKVYIGSRGKIMGKLGGLLKIGYELRHFDKIIVPDISKPRNSLIYFAQLYYTYSKKTDFYLASYSSDMYNSYIGRGMLKRYYYGLWCKYRLSRFTSISPRIYYIVDKYEVGGTATTPGLSLELKYAPYKWIDVTLKYDCMERDSDLKSDSYKNNIVSLSANIRF